MGNQFREILSRMSTRRGFLISTLVIAGLVLAACNHVSTPEPIATPIQPQVTETIPVYETPGATKTPFVEVTPIEGVDNTLEATPISERLTIEDIGPEDKIYTRGQGFEQNEGDLAIKTGIVMPPENLVVGWTDFDDYNKLFGETGLKFGYLSAYVADRFTYDKDSEMLILPLAIEVNGSLVNINVYTPYPGTDDRISCDFMTKRVGFPGYDFEAHTRSEAFAITEFLSIIPEIGKQILIPVPVPDSKQQYIDGMTYLLGTFPLHGISTTDSRYVKVEYLLNNVEREDAYSAINKLKNLTIEDGSSILVFMYGIRVTGIEGD